MRRRRTESSIELRKQKKDDQVLKRRNIATAEGDDEAPLSDTTNLNTEAMLGGGGVNNPTSQNTIAVASLTLKDIIQIILSLKNPDGSVASQENVFAAVQSVRKMLSRERNPPIDDVIKSNLVPSLVEFLSCEEHSAL